MKNYNPYTLGYCSRCLKSSQECIASPGVHNMGSSLYGWWGEGWADAGLEEVYMSAPNIFVSSQNDYCSTL